MVWGAVAGTLPDMDVLGQFFLNELDNLAFHRGISHSLTATVLGSLCFGWATDRLYRSPHHAKIAMAAKVFAVVVLGFVVNFLTQIFAPGGFLPVLLYPNRCVDLLATRPAPILQRRRGSDRTPTSKAGSSSFSGAS